MTSRSLLRLSPLLLDKVWGGDRLRGFGLPVPTGAHVGEAWLLADLGRTSTSGAGGGAMRSPVSGEAAQSLHDVVRGEQAHWLGDAIAGSDGAFPLLVKLLDAREHLSVQVHPSPRVANDEMRIKHECWHVLQAEPGSRLFLGLADGVDGGALAAALRDGRVPEVLSSVPAVVGECHFLPSGLVHALGAGVVVAEVQTPSDTTYRLYDWTREYGRAPRALHIEEALHACEPAARAVTRRADRIPSALLASTAAFDVHGITAVAPFELSKTRRPQVVVPIRGAARLVSGEDAAELTAGESVIIAAAAPPTRLLPADDLPFEGLVIDVRGELA